MRRMLLVALILPACAMSTDHTISGRYVSPGGDSPPVNGQIGASVVDITAKDRGGAVYDQGTFHAATQEGDWALTVPDGTDGVQLLFVDHKGEGADKPVTYDVLVPVTDDLDVGTVYLP